MNLAEAVNLDPVPFLIEGSRGALFATYFPPRGVPHAAGDVLVVPPFAEEMNRCRAMVAMQARALAEIGMGTLVLDLFGTGESDGDFVDATWEAWLDDLARGLAWLRAQGHGCTSVWGVRLGAVLACELAARDGGIEHLLLWQPVLNGKLFYTQFLRIRIAAELELPNRIKSTNELREKSASGEPIEVSGYVIGPALSLAIDRAELALPMGGAPLETAWFEVLASAESPVARASASAVEALQAAGTAAAFETVVGPPFWQVYERQVASDLITATTARVRAWRNASQRAALARPRQGSTADVSNGCVPLTFACGSERLAGMLHRSPEPSTRGVVIVVAGGPQYRAGAHRQFVTMARRLAREGHSVLRFDLRGMGDSSGTYLGFQESEPDLRAAVDTLLAHEPQMREVVLLGECESASGILFYAWRDARVKGAVLVNPWVRTEEGRAQVILKHYYLDRLRSKEFWLLVRQGRFPLVASLTSMAGVVRAYFRGKRLMAKSTLKAAPDEFAGLPLPVKTAVGLSRFRGEALLLMSGHDLIAREFDEVTAASKAWEGLLEQPNVSRVDIEGADHTFSKEPWKLAACDSIVAWLRKW